MSPLRGDTVNCPLCQCRFGHSDCVSLETLGPNSPVIPEFIPQPTDPDQLFECGPNGAAMFAPTWLTDPPACSVTCTIDQMVPWNTQWPLFFNQDTYDTDNMHSVEDQTSRITFNTSGIYLVNLIVRWKKVDVSEGDILSGIRKNTANFIAMHAEPIGEADLYMTQNVAVIHAFQGGEYVEAVVKQDAYDASAVDTSDPDAPKLNVPVTSTPFSPIFSAQFLRLAP